jgi:hypothetical protein
MIRPCFCVLLLAAIAFPGAAETTVEQACAGETADIFERLDCELRYEARRLEIDKTRADRQQLAVESGGGALANGFPCLRILYGRPGAVTALFALGGGAFEARVGDRVSDGWRMTAVLPDGVELSRGGERRAALLGGCAVTAPAAAAQ